MKRRKVQTKRPNDFYEKVGDLIRARREEAGLTQGQLGDRVGLTRNYISNFESDRQRIQIDKLYERAAAMNVEPSALLPRDEVGKSSSASPKMWKGLRLPREVRDWVVGMSVVTSQTRTLFDALRE